MTTGYVAIDLGAESGRAIVGSLDGGKVTLEEVHRFRHEPVNLPTGLHWNVTGLWQEICRGLKKAADWSKLHGVRLVSVGVDTWGVDWGLISPTGDLAGLPHAYRDPRNPAACQEVLDKLGIDKIYRTTGIQLMPFNTLYTLYAQWSTHPEMLQAGEQLLLMPDLFHYWLSGKKVVEATNASTSQMVDCQTRIWSAELIEPLGIPMDILGTISPPGTKVGPLLPELAAETGLPEDLMVVAPATHDTASAIAAVPADPSTQWCYLSSGTWSLLGVELDEPCSGPQAQEAMFTNEYGVGNKTRFLKNIAGLWLVQECRRDLERQGQEFTYPELTQQAFEADAFRTLVDPDHEPFGSPGGMIGKLQEFARHTNQPEPQTPGELVRCCLESLALAYRQTMLKLEEVLGRSFTHLHIVGGGGKNALLNQMTADATGKSVCVGPDEATATGNVLVQALAVGDIADLEGLRTVVANSFELAKFEPAAGDAWEKAFERFLASGLR